ncbi:hypothetical protein D3C80_2031240 [compost metagenome]
MSGWNAFGVVTEMTSISGSESRSRQLPVERAKPNSSAFFAASSGLTSASVTRRGRSTSPKTLVTLFHASAWHLPM